MKNETLLEFPCNFPIKVIGDNTGLFAEEILKITQKHFPDFVEKNLKSKLSKDGKFISLSITVFATNKETLDALYLELTSHANIRMVL